MIVLTFCTISFAMAEELANMNDDLIDIKNGVFAPSKVSNETYEDFFTAGLQALRKGNNHEAIEALEQSRALKHNVPQTHFNLCIAYELAGDEDKAIASCKNALNQKYNYPKAHHQLAKMLHKKGNIDEAISHFEEALKQDSKLVEPALTLARLYCGKEKFESALPYFDRYVKEAPHNNVALFEYANALNTAHRTEQALELYFDLVKKYPNDAGILYNTAYTLKKLGRIDEALDFYRRTLERNPNHAEGHFSLGLTHLALGNFEEGWEGYEWRWQRNSQLSPREFRQPRWDGSPLHGKTILIHAEQGLGDTFQFIRYAKIIKEQYGGTILFASQTPLETIVRKCCPYIDRVATLAGFPTNFDVHAPLLSLPFILKSNEKTIPKEIPYLYPDEKLVDFWAQRLSQYKGVKVGICWQGNSKYSTPFLRSVVAAKSIAMKKFAQLADVEGITFFSLQRVTGTDQLNQLPSEFKLVTFETDFDQSHGRFMDTAAVIKNLDLVISVDTSICHLSAAIGIPVWTILPEPADWRWMLKRANTPWYPNMRLFRQPKRGDWDSIMTEVKQELIQFVATKQSTVPLSPKHIEQQLFQGVRAIKEPLDDATPKQYYSVADQLKKELAYVKQQFKITSHDLSTKRMAADDKPFLDTIRMLYHLAEIHDSLKLKLAALEGAA